MPIPARILRAAAEDIKRPDTGPSANRDHIIAVARCLMARHGRTEITFANLAIALCIGTTTLRNHFADLDALLGEILRRHLLALSNALGRIPTDAADPHKARRAAYYAFTRTALGGFTEAHLLLLRDSTLLPPDERETIDIMHQGLAALLGGPMGEEALDLLDMPRMALPRIETILATPTAAADYAADYAAPAPESPRPPLQRPADPEAPGAWIFSAGLPGLPPVPAEFVLPNADRHTGQPSLGQPGLGPPILENCLAAVAAHTKNRAARRMERSLRATTRAMAKLATSRDPPKPP
jgi:AcrR family transcriptional regulator